MNHQRHQTFAHEFVVINNLHTKCADTRANATNPRRMDRYADGIALVTTASLT